MKLEYPQAVYIHIPFCRRRCYYCDFPISVLGVKTQPEDSGMIKEYVKALSQEIGYTSGKPVKTVFFGGGTPSLLPLRDLESILTTIDKSLGITADAEISLEIDPGTFTISQLQGYRQLGVNRLSLGVQAFQEHLLQTCGRSHNLEDVETAIALIQEMGSFNWSLDLISGLPNQSLADWEESLMRAIAVKPHHLSCYDLVLEPVTAFGRLYQPGKQPLPSDKTTASMYRLAQNLLTQAGYQHYEISNYAQPGYQCRHNRVYWENRPYYAFGMGAASYVNGIRYTRPRTRAEYYAWVERGSIINEDPVTPEDIVLETLMLGLRLTEGVSLFQFNKKTQELIIKTISPYIESDWVELTLNEKLCLRDPEGLLFSNTILATLFEKLG